MIERGRQFLRRRLAGLLGLTVLLPASASTYSAEHVIKAECEVYFGGFEVLPIGWTGSAVN